MFLPHEVTGGGASGGKQSLGKEGGLLLSRCGSGVSPRRGGGAPAPVAHAGSSIAWLTLGERRSSTEALCRVGGEAGSERA